MNAVLSNSNLKQTSNEFDPLFDSSDEFLRNPYPIFEQLRQEAPLVWRPRGHHWLVSGYEEANIILRDSAFGKRLDKWKQPSLLKRAIYGIMSHNFRNILRQDPPEHTRVRGSLTSAFVPSVIRKLEPEIQRITDSLIDSIESSDRFDLVSQFAFPLPVTVIAELLGVPPEDQDRFKQWSTEIIASVQGNFCPYRTAKSLGASFELRQYLRKIVDGKRKAPAQDLISALTQISSEDSSRLSEKELINNSVLILIAGHETTVNLIGNGVYNLLKYPHQRKLLEENPELFSTAVEEILRFDSPVQMVQRIAMKDVTVGGTTIKAGEAATVLIGACNRDPRFFEKPDVFNIERDNKRHVSFGAGVHYCIGAELARAEARIALSTLFKRLPTMKLDNLSPDYKGPFALRGLKHLPISF